MRLAELHLRAFGNFSDVRLDLDAGTTRQGRNAHSGACRIWTLEKCLHRLVDYTVIAQIGQIHGEFDHRFQIGSGRFGYRAQVFKRTPGFGLDTALNQFSGSRIEPDLTRQKDPLPGANRL